MPKETRLQQMLAHLRTRLLLMTATTQNALEDSLSAMISQNLTLASKVIRHDSDIDSLETEIDGLCLNLLALEHPYAHDLCLVIGAMRMVVDLERVGDESVNIAERAILLHEKGLPTPVATLAELTDLARTLFANAVEALRLGDKNLAIRVRSQEPVAIEKEIAALQMSENLLCQDEGQAKVTLMNHILACRALSRICRHSVNIAEQVYFILEGVNLKHTFDFEPPPA